MTWTPGRRYKKSYKINDRAYRMIEAARIVIKDSQGILDDDDIDIIRANRAVLELKQAMERERDSEIKQKINLLGDEARSLDNKIRRNSIMVFESEESIPTERTEASK